MHRSIYGLVATLALSASLAGMGWAADSAASKKEEAAKPESQWTDSLTKAVAQAKADNKVIMLDFTGSDWCGYCMKLKAAVFDTDDFKQYASQNLVLMDVDFPHKKELSKEVKEQNEKLKQKYQPGGYPTIVFIQPNGNELGRLEGFDGDAKAWSKQAADIVKKGAAKGTASRRKQ